MLNFDFSDWERKARQIEGAARQLPFLLSYSLNNAMKDARAAEIEVMKSVFDRPTPYTLNSLAVIPSSKQRLVAELRTKEFGRVPAWKYLGPEIEGGPRRSKGFERALRAKGLLRPGEYVVPSKNLELDAYGNVKGGYYQRVLSDLGAQRDAAQNSTAKSRKKRVYAGRYFVSGGVHSQRGIYYRDNRSPFPSLVFVFVRMPSYSKRFPFYEAAHRVVPAAFRRHFNQGFDRFILSELRKKG